MSLLTRLFRVGHKTNGKSKPKAKARPTRRSQLFLEPLEDRVLLATRFVVPLEIPINNSTTFHTLRSALTTAGLAVNDVIQIEPGSSPGNIRNSNFPGVANITIQGNPSVTAAETPVFAILDNVIITQTAFTLSRVNLSLVGGNLTFNAADARIVDSIVTNNFFVTAGIGAIQLNSVRTVISNSIIRSDAAAGAGISTVIEVNGVADSQNQITGNTIFSTAFSSAQILIDYQGSVAVNDLVANNLFLGNPSNIALFNVRTSGLSGLTIQNNTFQDADPSQNAIAIDFGHQNINIVNNVITLTGGSGTVGIFMDADATATLSVTIAGNQINTGGTGTGIQISPFGGPLNVRIEGNDFHSNAIGIRIQAGGGGPVSGIDLGGGGPGSLGGNNFRGFTNGNIGSAAINNGAALSQGNVNAQFNIFSVANPESAIFDGADNAGASGDVIATGFLTGNTAFVQTLYLEFLHRAGTAPELAFKVNQLATGTPVSTLVNSVVKSTEGLGHVVDDLYLRFLNRAADAGGKAFFISQIQGGRTIESIICSFVASAEYRLTFGSDAAFVFSLYTKLLGRAGDNGGLAFWTGQVALIGRANVSKAFLNGPEYRGIVVTRLYQQLFHRTPGGAEVSFWVGTGLTELALTVQYASSTEFRNNG